MTEPSFLDATVGESFDAFLQLSPDQRAERVRAALPDLHAVFDRGRVLAEREAPPRTIALARSLFDAVVSAVGSDVDGPALAARLITDRLLREELDRDQNVYLGKLFTRTLTHAVPDLVFQPASHAELTATLQWARHTHVPVTLRGAGTTAMGGAVPNDGGLTLDLSRLDGIELSAEHGVCVVGAGARLRSIHQNLARRGFALEAYPSNLGGTLAGWFLTGGIGLNAFGRGCALDMVRAADLVLPTGEHVRFHDDGRLDVPGDDGRHSVVAGEQATAWFHDHGYIPLTLADLAGSEGVFGALVQLTVSVEPRAAIGALLLSFDSTADAFEAVAWIDRSVERAFARPANLKFMSGSHVHHIRRVWADEDGRAWHARPGSLTSGASMPWTALVGPAALGAIESADDEHAEAYLFVDFLDLDEARGFVRALGDCPGAPRVLGEESVRFAAERFKPQQTKRLGPGLLAAEIVLLAAQVPAFLPAAEALARGAGGALDTEVYYVGDGSALLIGAYLTDHRTGAITLDLMLAPALLDLAMSAYGGRPYVLGRWQSAWFGRRFERLPGARLRLAKARLDPHDLVNRGVLFGLRLHGVLGALLAASFVPAIGALRVCLGSGALSVAVRAARGLLRLTRGPAAGRGEPAAIGARFAVSPAEGDGGPGATSAPRAAAKPAPVARRAAPAPRQAAAARALNCVNCGECNSVCPVFHESKIRLPQMLTHLGECVVAGETLGPSAGALLDLCMRCGKCEEVCQAGIPHLPLYEEMQRAADRERPRDPGRQAAILTALRTSPRYTREFLDIRPGGYLKRAPASLPGVARFVLLRAEGDAGPAATCIHCAACVAVCPTGANREFQGADARWITTDQKQCIGCGTCVEVCPANHMNGGQTLRVMEAPTGDWFAALEEFELLAGPVLGNE